MTLAHEDLCFDSLHERFFFSDDFEGVQLKDIWREAGTGSAAVVDPERGAAIRLTTGAVIGNAYRIDWGDYRILHVLKRVSLEVRTELSSVSDIDVRLCLRFDANNLIMFRFDDSVDTNWMIVTTDGGAPTVADSGETPDTSYHIFRIVCHTHGGNHVHFFIDDLRNEVTNSPISTNVPDDAGDFLQPYLYVETEAAVAKSIDNDYVYIRQDR